MQDTLAKISLQKGDKRYLRMIGVVSLQGSSIFQGLLGTEFENFQGLFEIKVKDFQGLLGTEIKDFK